MGDSERAGHGEESGDSTAGRPAAADSDDGTTGDALDVTVSLDSDAAHAYERIVSRLEQQHDQEIDVDDHAERILRKYIAEEYRKLILNGSSATEIRKLPEE